MNQEKSNVSLSESKIINPKIFTYIKYLLTFSLVLFYTIPALAFLHTLDRLHLNTSSLLKLQVVLIIVASLSMIVYFYFKFSLHKKTGYHYSKTEKNYLILFSILNAVLVVLAVTYAIYEINYQNNTAKILFYIFESLIIIFGVAASILEQQSRINEQIYLYNLWYETLDESDKVKEQQKAKSPKKTSDQVVLDQKVVTKEITKDTKNPFMSEEEVNHD